MDYSDWLIISVSLIMIVFLTLLGLAIFETDLKDTSWFLWGSVGGFVLSIIAVAVLIWYFKGKGNNKKKDKLTTGKGSINGEKDKLTTGKGSINGEKDKSTTGKGSINGEKKIMEDDEEPRVSKILTNDLQNVR